jgi:hypothetical protein
MASEIAGVVHSVRMLMDLLKANKSLANYNELVSAVSEVNADLLSAQATALTSQKNEMALIKRNSELEKEIVELKNWQREAERYQLTEVTPGIPAYVVKPGMENGEPSHALCANYFTRKQKSFLQHNAARPAQLQCAHCKSEFSPSEERQIRVTRLTRG